MANTKYLFVTGGVCSSLGKGITASSIGALIRAAGYKVNMMKIDPYLNVDAGTMRPYEHGEVYVTDDGFETDLDLGNYERFVRVNTTQLSSLTTGQVYQTVIDRERRGDYLGQTVQVIPHVTDEIKRRIRVLDQDKNSDVVIVELGGTVGDIEGIPFIEAVRQFSLEEGRDNVKFAHLTLIPTIKASGELKTKPTQHSVKTLMSMGIQPEFLFCRSETILPAGLKAKLALFCNVEEKCLFTAVDVKNIYEIPLTFHAQEADKIIMERLGLKPRRPDLSKWKQIVNVSLNPKHDVTIAFVGKYTELNDAYKSVDEALRHGGLDNEARVEIRRIEAEELEKGNMDSLKDADGILIPGGFGSRAIEGKIAAAGFGRENKVPTFGICLGLQCMVISYARDKCNFPQANSREFSQDTPHPVIELLANLKGIKYMGGTMRKGASETLLHKETLVHKIYKKDVISERHRHRYEVNPEYTEALASKGLKFSGHAESGLVEVVELDNHPWYLGVQFHPEFKSSPIEAAPLFSSFIAAAVKQAKSKGK